MSVVDVDTVASARSRRLTGLLGRESTGGGRLTSGLVSRASESVHAGAGRLVPVREELSDLLPWRGLRRGTSVAVAPGPARGGPGSTTLLLALVSAAVDAGSWCAVVGMPELHPAAAAELGVTLDRLVLVPDPGAEWSTVTAMLLEGVDIVVLRPPGPVAPRLARRLTARARQRGGVLIPCGGWDGAEVTLRVTDQVWYGLGAGRGRLRGRELTVVAYGRGAAARPRSATLRLPSPGGDAAPAGGDVPAGGAAPARGDALMAVPGVPGPAGEPIDEVAS